MGVLIQDLRYATRLLVRNGRLTAAILLTMALGIGANSAIFSVVNGVLLRPLSFRDPDRLVALWAKWPSQYGQERLPVSQPDFRDWESQNAVFDKMALYGFQDVTVRLGATADRLMAYRVTEAFFDVLGASPAWGRRILPGECTPGGNRTVILSYSTWQGRFGGRPNILGQQLFVDGTPHTIVGVMPADFKLSLQFFLKGFNSEPALWISQYFNDSQRGNHDYYTLARLKPGVSQARAQSDMTTIVRRLEQQYPDSLGMEIEVMSLRRSLYGHLQAPLLLLLAVTGLVLVIACANIANLLLARRAQREREMAIRTALGAGRMQLVRQLLTESWMLSLLGGLLGLGIALWGCQLFNMATDRFLTGHALPQVSVDGRVLSFALLVSLLAGLIFGLTPAVQTSRFDIRQGLKDGSPHASQGRGKRRLVNILAIGELALSLMLLIASGLLMKSFWGLLKTHPGFRADNMLSLRLSLSGNEYASAERRLSFFQQVQDEVSRLPGVQAAGWVDFKPGNGARGWSFYPEGQPEPAMDKAPDANVVVASPGYLEALAIPLIRGRFIAPHDNDPKSPPVVVINQTLARQQWGNQDPVGRRIFLFSTRSWTTVVGVVGDIRQNGLAQPPVAQMHLPYMAFPVPYSYLLVRTHQEPLSLAAVVRREIRTLDPNLPVTDLQTMQQALSESVADKQYVMWLVGSFALIALLLAAIGIYAVLSYSVSQRTTEIGIRMALGAQPGSILIMVLQQGSRLVVFGVSLGLLAAWSLTRLLASQLVGVAPTDPVVFGLVALLLSAIALLACYRPARRATRVDPLTSFRCQ